MLPLLRPRELLFQELIPCSVKSPQSHEEINTTRQQDGVQEEIGILSKTREIQKQFLPS